MDLIKIGKYISEKRKDLGMTQKQLAEQLGMSDKSVSKWERGVCLPDVSVYDDLCSTLGISINEFLAGEDIDKELIVQKSEENIIEVSKDGMNRQKRLKTVIGVLAVLLAIVVIVVCVLVLRRNRTEPQNYIELLPPDSVEMQTVGLLAGSDGAFVYKFASTDEYDQIRIYISEYHSGELVSKDYMDLGFDSVGSPGEGEIILMPDFENFQVKVIIATNGARLSTEVPILEGVEGREWLGRGATSIYERIDIRYDEEQALLALIYDNDEMSVSDIFELISEESETLQENDYVYYFSFEFCKAQ